ncbi:MAG: hypothetical protein GX639_19120 [Fibrobacter sp.]|nr:hypothetical protein [Fibrobacter sp.]
MAEGNNKRFIAAKLPEVLIIEFQLYCVRMRMSHTQLVKEAVAEYMKTHPVSE